MTREFSNFNPMQRQMHSCTMVAMNIHREQRGTSKLASKSETSGRITWTTYKRLLGVPHERSRSLLVVPPLILSTRLLLDQDDQKANKDGSEIDEKVKCMLYMILLARVCSLHNHLSVE